MSTTSLGERIAYRHRLVGAALAVLTAEHNLAGDPSSAKRLIDAETALELAAQNLTACIDELPPQARPKGWGIGPGAETA